MINCISGIMLIVLGLVQLGFSIYYFILSRKRYIPELPKGSEIDAAVSVSGKLIVGGIDIEEFVRSTDLYVKEMNKTVRSVNKITGIVTTITGILTLIVGTLQLFMR